MLPAQISPNMYVSLCVYIHTPVWHLAPLFLCLHESFGLLACGHPLQAQARGVCVCVTQLHICYKAPTGVNGYKHLLKSLSWANALNSSLRICLSEHRKWEIIVMEKSYSPVLICHLPSVRKIFFLRSASLTSFTCVSTQGHMRLCGSHGPVQINTLR